MKLINILMKEGKLKDNLHDIRWKLTSDDDEVTKLAHTLKEDTCGDCGGVRIEMAVEGLGFRTQSCMKCGRFSNFDYEYSKTHESGGGFGAIQLVTKDRSIVVNYGFKEPLWKRTLMDLRNEIIHFPNIDIEKSFVIACRENDYLYWLGDDVEKEFYIQWMTEQRSKVVLLY